MKRIRILRTFAFALLLSTIVSFASSCSDDDDVKNVGNGTVSGIVTDDANAPIPDVTVTVSGMEGSTSTAADGKYTFPNVSMEKHAVIFTKTGYQTTSATVVAGKFGENNTAIINVSMIDASAKITGTITDAKNNGAPLPGVTITVGAMTATSGSDGKYVIENLPVDDYTVAFSLANYVSLTRTISKNDFVDKVATIDVRMGGTELLRGLTADDLAGADKWYYNEYRGGGNDAAYPHWDWACDYLCSMTFWGNWEEQWEGTTLRIRNDGNEQKNPADLDVFDSYTYGSKKITADNKILSLRLRTHNADDASPAYFGVQVVDLSAAEPKAVKIGETRQYGSENYADFHFDLSEFIGKEVIVAIGIYRQETGDYWKQLVLRAIRFADRNVGGWDWLPGNEVVEDWKLTHETVRSTMPHLKKSFTGISPMSAGRDVNMVTGYPAAYRAWRGVSHVGHEWSFVPLKKDPEGFAGQGYVIKTRSTPEVNTIVPEAYMYAKFPIASGSNELTFKTRNFDSGSAPGRYTYFKLTAITEEGTVTHIAPKSNTALDASAAENGCWKFKHYAGEPGDPENYASFVYDLSQFNGKDVVLVIGVYNGAANTSENKLAFYSIDLK